MAAVWVAPTPGLVPCCLALPLLAPQAELDVLYPALEADAAGSTDNAVLALTCRDANQQVGEGSGAQAR